MMTPDRLTLFMNFILVLPMLLLFPGFIFSRTFLVLPAGMAFCERLFARILMSLIASSFLGLGLAAFAVFTEQNLVLGMVVLSFLCFLFKRFKLYSGILSIRINVEDVIVVLVLFLGIFFFFWPSEKISVSFALGRCLARTGSLAENRGMAEWPFLLKGPLISVWYAVVDGFFGIRASLLAAPLFSTLSLLALFFLAKQWTSDLGAGFMTAALYLSNFTAVWLGRLPEGFSLCQLMMLGALYFGKISWEEKRLIFLIPSFSSLFLAFFAWPGALWNIVPMALGFLFLLFFIRPDSQDAQLRRTASEPLPVFASENVLRFLGASFLGFWIFTYFQAPESVRSTVPALYWVLASLGLFRIIFNTSSPAELTAWIVFFISPWVFYKRDLTEGGIWEHLLLLFFPAVACLSGCFLSYLSKFNRWTQWLMISAVVLGTALPVYLDRDLLFAKDYDGTIDFYDKLKRNFLPNDLVFSQDAELASLLWNLFDIKVYLLPEEGLDISYQNEIREWMKDGGKAFVLSRSQMPEISGFTLHLQSVERLRTIILEHPELSSRQKKLHQIFVQIYEAVPRPQPE